MYVYIYTQSSFIFDMFYSSSCRMSKVGQCCSPRRRGHPGHPLTRPESAGKKMPCAAGGSSKKPLILW